MKRFIRTMVLVGALSLLTMAAAVPAFAQGPAVPVATGGLGIALTQVLAHTPGKGANPPLDTPIPAGYPGAGTHTAVGHIMLNNPAVDVCALGGPCP